MKTQLSVKELFGMGCRLSLLMALIAMMNFAFGHPAKSFLLSFSSGITDSAIEKKVDYIERIYFSGQNKAGLVSMILATTQEMESKPATEAVARQYIFLSGIKQQANDAETACDVEEMLAAGICDIDPSEAASQNITRPSAKVGAKISAALAGANDIGNSAGNNAVAGFVLSGGNYEYLGAANAAFKGAAIAGAASDYYATGKKVVSLFHHLVDNPCKRVTVKTIDIGPHVVAVAAESVDK